MGLSGPCEVLSQQGAALGQVQDLGHLLPRRPWGWKAWPSRDPGYCVEPGLGGPWWFGGTLLMAPQTLPEPNNGDSQRPGQACVPTGPFA